MKKMIFNLSMVAGFLLVAACGGGDSDFNGTFIGQETSQLGGGQSIQVTAQLQANGNNITGNYITSGQAGQQNGQVTGIVQGNQISQFVVNFNSGNGGSGCPLQGTGSQTQGVITMQMSGCGQQTTVQLRRQQ